MAFRILSIGETFGGNLENEDEHLMNAMDTGCAGNEGMGGYGYDVQMFRGFHGQGFGLVGRLGCSPDGWLCGADGGCRNGSSGNCVRHGKIAGTRRASVPQVRKATLAALEDLSLPIHQNKGDKLSAQIESETADGKAIWVKVNFVTESLSELIIRVGLRGDEQRSREILQAIKRHLS